MFGKSILFCLLAATFTVCNISDTFARNLVGFNRGIDSSNFTHIRSKRATYNTFIASHTLNPATTDGYPFTTHNQWLRWLELRENDQKIAFMSDEGRDPPTLLRQKNVNTIIIAAPEPIRHDFANPIKSGKHSWSNSKYRVVKYKSKKGRDPKFLDCPGVVHILATLDGDGRPFHLQDFCYTRQQILGQSCSSTIPCRRIP